MPLILSPTIALAFAPLIPHTGDIKSALALTHTLGYHAAQLPAAQKGIRPRDLDQRARKDLLATLSRTGLTPSGLDLLIPLEHWHSPKHQDRATTSLLAALELAAQLGQIPVSTTLPTDPTLNDIVTEIITAADARSTPIALHNEAEPDQLAQLLSRHDTPFLGVALSPALALAHNHPPHDLILRFADRLLTTRLDDYQPSSSLNIAARTPIGQGTLDLQQLRATLTAANKLRALIADPRDLPNPKQAAADTLEQWNNSQPF